MGTHLLLNDVLFKIVFGTQGNSRILGALLNALLGLKGPDRIVSLTIQKSDLEKENVVQKGVVLDVVARDGQGRLYDIEVQVHNRPAFIKRAYYYLNRLAATELQQGEQYDKLPKILGIFILDFTLFEDRTDLHSTYRLYDKVHEDELSDVVELHFVELSKFAQDKPRDLATPFEKWLHILKFAEFYRGEDQALPEVLEHEEGIAMAMDAMKTALTKEEVLVMMALRDKLANDEANSIRQALEDGRAEGRAEGLAEGRVEVARKMLAEGMDRASVSKFTGLLDQNLP